MARGGEVNTDLVRAPGLQLDGDQGRAVEPLDRAVARDGPLSFLAGARDAAPQIAAVPHEVGGEAARVGQAAFDDRQVLPVDRVAPEEILERMERATVARQDDGAGRVFVEAVHHERGGAPLEAVVQVVEDAREQRVLLLLGRGNGEESRRLVHDQEVGVFGEDRETRADPVPRRTAGVKSELRSLGHLAARLVRNHSLDLHPSGAHRIARRAPRETEGVGHGQVEPHRTIGTRISMKKPGSPTRASGLAPGPKTAATEKSRRSA